MIQLLKSSNEEINISAIELIGHLLEDNKISDLNIEKVWFLIAANLPTIAIAISSSLIPNCNLVLTRLISLFK